jgi:uncharacterized membrane protein
MRKLLICPLAALLCSLAAVASAQAADIKVEAKLVWGANDEKGDGKCKPVENDLSSKLHGTFKWKSYFEITNQAASIALNKTTDLKMSDRCTIQIKNLGESRIEVNCIGDGKQVCKGAYTLNPPTWLVLGGNATNDTAWFIALRAVDSNPAEAKRSLTTN